LVAQLHSLVNIHPARGSVVHGHTQTLYY